MNFRALDTAKLKDRFINEQIDDIVIRERQEFIDKYHVLLPLEMPKKMAHTRYIWGFEFDQIFWYPEDLIYYNFYEKIDCIYNNIKNRRFGESSHDDDMQEYNPGKYDEFKVEDFTVDIYFSQFLGTDHDALWVKEREEGKRLKSGPDREYFRINIYTKADYDEQSLCHKEQAFHYHLERKFNSMGWSGNQKKILCGIGFYNYKWQTMEVPAAVNDWKKNRQEYIDKYLSLIDYIRLKYV